MRTTIIYAPHPDDETLYLGSYITVCRNRGDRLVLVAATDGGSSGARPAGWTENELMAFRRQEQTSAWRNLTGLSTSSIIRIGAIDSKDPNLRAKIKAKAEELETLYSADGSVEHYGACNNGMNQGVDHDAVALGLRDAYVRVARFANRCYDTKGSIYTPPNSTAMGWMKNADSSYSAFGHASVASFFKSLRDLGYRNRVVA